MNEQVNEEIVNYVAERIGDVNSAQRFVQDFDKIEMNLSDKRYVISPVYWILLSMIPEDFAASAPTISFYLGALIRDLRVTKSIIDSNYLGEKNILQVKRSEAEAIEFLDRKERKDSDKVAAIYAKKATLPYDKQLVLLECRYRLQSELCDANIDYAKSCLFAVKDYVASIREVDSIRAAHADEDSIRRLIGAFVSVPKEVRESVEEFVEESEERDKLMPSRSDSKRESF